MSRPSQLSHERTLASSVCIEANVCTCVCTCTFACACARVDECLHAYMRASVGERVCACALYACVSVCAHVGACERVPNRSLHSRLPCTPAVPRRPAMEGYSKQVLTLHCGLALDRYGARPCGPMHSGSLVPRRCIDLPPAGNSHLRRLGTNWCSAVRRGVPRQCGYCEG